MAKFPRRADEHTLGRRITALERRIAQLEKHLAQPDDPDDPAPIDPGPPADN